MAKFTKMCFLVLLGLLVLSVTINGAAVHHHKRAADGKNDEKPCVSNTPCGWAVYVPFTRSVDYFMKNSCECPAGKQCIRTDDDISVSAYVYRCRVME